MWVVLNDTEQKLAEHLANSRYNMNRSQGVCNKRIGPQGDWETDLEGVGAEIAFCKNFNVYPDLSLDGHPTEDAILKCGKRVDVKSTKYDNGHLIAVLGKRNKAPDLYALVVGKFPRYRIAGFIEADELLKDERIMDFGYGPTYAIEQGELKKF